MAAGEMEIIAPDRRKHHDEMTDLISKVFSHRGYFGFRDYCRDSYIDHSNYDWDASRIGLIGGRIVTHWGVWGYTMRIGTARVKTGGIGVVATHGDFRKRGLMDRTARASIQAMRDLGYDFSILFGIDDFYDRFGYVRAWSGVAYIVNVADLPSEKPAARFVKFAPRHRDDLAAIYNRQYATITGTAVRPTYLRNRRPDRWQGYLWSNARGAAQGYAIVSRDNTTLECIEAAGDAEQTLRVLAALCRRWGCHEVRFPDLQHETPLARRLRRSTCRMETYPRRCGGPMVRTLNLPAALDRMSAELSRRLRASHLAGWRGRLLIADAREKAMLAIGRSRARTLPPAVTTHTIRGSDQIAQLLIGTDEPDEVVEAGGIRLTGDARKLIQVLFPNQHPQLGVWDSF